MPLPFMNKLREKFEEQPPEVLNADIIMFSGCEDEQTSADVSSVQAFKLPDPAGRAGGACTSTLLNILYKDEETPSDTMSFVEVLNKMREDLTSRKFTQIPQLCSSKKIDMNKDFDLVPPQATGTRRAVMVGINYVGHEQGVLSGCHNDVKNMKRYIKRVHKFQENNIITLLDDGVKISPTRENILASYKKIVSLAEPGDALFFHYSGHGCSVKDDTGDEEDGKDETLVPLDYQTAGMIRDDDMYDIIVKELPKGVFVTCIFDCCHSGTVLDLPYHFRPDQEGGNEMCIPQKFNFQKLYGKIGAEVQNML